MHRDGDQRRQRRGAKLAEVALFLSIAMAIVVGGLSTYREANVAAEVSAQARVLTALVAEARARELEGLTITIARKAGDEGRLFGSVGTSDVAQALEDAGLLVMENDRPWYRRYSMQGDTPWGHRWQLLIR